MKRKIILRVLALILIIAAASLAVYLDISNREIQKENEQIIERFNDITERVQEGDREEASEEGVINDEGYLINDSGDVISEHPVVFQADLDRLYTDSVSYNDFLMQRQDMDVDFSRSALDLSNYGIYDDIYGYFTAPAIGLNVPIYLGASNDNMAWGSTHLMNTSLPIGGKGTNTVIAGHTGYIGISACG